jgi:hypothetical protein
MEIDLDNLTDDEKVRAWDTLVKLTRSKAANSNPENQMIARILNLMLRSAVALSNVFAK